MSGGADHRRELAAFLRARREAIRPEQVGLPVGRGRRTPGLRREEVALLAGVSVTWYTWLEQGRRINASDDVLLAIGRALRLDEAGQDHLLALTDPGTADVDAPAEAPSALTRLLDSLMPAPAYVLGPRWEFVAWNTAQERLYPRIVELEPPRRNLLWVLFADPATRELIIDWDIHARQALAEFRSATSAIRHDAAMTELIDLLCEESAEFAAWWPEHDVSGFETRLRRFQHPAAGELTFEYQQLAPVEWPSLRVVAQLPVPDDDSAERLSVRHYLV
ncbi:helix-turn-helix transcriptional regulator [Ilumatobacter coccineus]|uniref:Putative DNA-binding protein n=1 Tax=Ilumatobacter coccineus (strain NBRC 103263 / KCTC 29153 / YM16-304) TaxID=1313172 RepID=A0A6C7EAB5_ILUCY|nr:helix-turn-helix transcriptional regulator [Ilumatobacter coccineus]BAN03401.1 putative DNA-binding protein [Ilumatobacter coccineus YM16-304]